LIGPPGAGKETQARELCDMFGLVHVSVKQMLKSELKRNPTLVKGITPYLEKGENMPE